MKFPRCTGILLHPTSLHSRFGIGDLGPCAYEFVEFLAAAGQKLWQVLPLNPTGYGDSPYQCFSAFAGNPVLISLDKLQDSGMLERADLENAPAFPAREVDYARVIEFKLPVLWRAAAKFLAAAGQKERCSFDDFCRRNAIWLDDYALFMAAKDAHNVPVWTDWPGGLRDREPAALTRFATRFAVEIQVFKYWQFEFFRQWDALKQYCQEHAICIMGDLPIYVAHDSADVWANRHIFQLDGEGRPARVAGVPPDYFSAVGQLWGNPVYRWDVLRKCGYRWWIERLRGSLRLFDVVRLDHFRGFEAYWEIPAGGSTAVNGRWVKGPGAELFQALERELGELQLVAENLGVITQEVENLRMQFGFPGMSLLQFAFGNDPQGPSFRPHNYVCELVAYTGGHDNDTTVGWWTSAGAGDSTRTEEDIRKERAFATAYLGLGSEPINWAFIRAVMASVADTAIIPLQDVLGLGSEARMNLPGRTSGNWRWRLEPGALKPEIAERLKSMTAMYDR